MPAPADLLARITRISRAPGGIANGIEDVETLPRAVLDMLTTGNAAFADAEAGGFLEAMGDVIVGLGIWGLALAVLALVVAFRILEVELNFIADHLPFGIGASQLRTLTHNLFSPIDSLESWVANLLWDAAQMTGKGLYVMLHVAVLYFVGDAGNFGKLNSTQQLKQLQHEYNDLIHKYNVMEKQIYALQNELPAPTIDVTNPLSTVQVPTSLTTRVKRLEDKQITIVHNVNVLHGDYNRLSQNQTNFAGRLSHLEDNYRAVRSEQYGVQDTLAEFTATVAVLAGTVASISPKVDSSVRQLAVMQPLEQLLYLGQPGITNLQKLEQNPCQCDSWPQQSVPNSQMLAAWEFLSHG